MLHVSTGGHLADINRVENDVLEIREALAGRAGASRYTLLSVSCNLRTAQITISRISNSGRPLYYSITKEGDLVIASHLRFFIEAGIPLEENSPRLSELLMYRMLMCPQTLALGVHQLRAGETVELTRDGSTWKARTVSIFNPPKAQPEGFVEGDLVRDAQRHLEETFHATNPEPGRFVSLLSGGLDSTLLTKFAYDIFGTKESFSCTYPFEDPSDDIEERYARTAAENIGTQHELYIPTMAEYLHGVIDTVYHAEQPMMHLQSVLLHLINKNLLAPRGYNIVANGEGADGIFGLKTHRFINYLVTHPVRRGLIGLPPVAAAIRTISTITNRYGLIARMAGAKVDPATPLTDPKHIVWSDAVFGYWPWIRQYAHADLQNVIKGRADALAEYQKRDLLEQVSIIAFLGEGTQTQLIWSMLGDSSGVGYFYPFPNPQLVQAAYKAPWPYKLGEPKKALRDLARKLGIGEFIITRPKAAFGIRSERYGPRGSVFEPLIAVAAKGIEEVALRQMQSPEIYRAQTLFTLINLAFWRRMFINRESPQVLHDELDREMHRLGVLETFKKPGRVSHMIQ